MLLSFFFIDSRKKVTFREETWKQKEEGSMGERQGATTMKGNPLTLVGNEIKVGDKAPSFEVIGNDLSVTPLSSYEGKICIISSVPSLDTPVCEIETARFNSEAANLSDEIVILTISMDLPFAQKRWCGANGVDKVITLSDHRDATFGTAYGVLIKELRLLARAVFVVDREGIVRYVELVKEIANEPDYDAVLKAARECV
jgi:thiol peroxidase